jgi:DNA-binding response OmpR family regulator
MEATSPELVYPNAKRFGASGYLVKPFGLLELLAARVALLRGEMYYPLDNPTKAEEQMREAEILVRHIKELTHRA